MARSRVYPVFAVLFVIILLVVPGQLKPLQLSNLVHTCTNATYTRPIPQPQVAEKHHHRSTVPQWLAGQQVQLPQGLIVNPHAVKHVGQKLDAYKLQTIMLEGRCAASGKWQYCGKDLYICFDPVTGLVGGLFVVGDQIVSGFAAREGYWHERTIEGELNINNCGTKYAIH